MPDNSSKPNVKSVLEYANWIVESQEEKRKTQEAVRAVFFLEDGLEHKVADLPENNWMVPIVDPMPNNAIRTMANILSNKPPRISVKIPEEAITKTWYDKTSAWAVARYRRLPEWAKRLGEPKLPSEKLQETFENVLRYVFQQNDNRRDGALRRDLALDGFITDQMAVKCVDLRLTNLWQGKDPKAFEGQSPFLFQRIDPVQLYVMRNELGVSHAIHRYLRLVRDVKALYGERIRGDIDELKDEQNNVLFCEQWWCEGGAHYKCAWIEKVDATYSDLDEQIKRCAWVVDESGDEIQENALGFIPIIAKTCNGSGNDIMPVLYAAVQSGMNVASNVAWTIRSSLALKLANMPIVFSGWDGSQPVPKIDFTKISVLAARTGQDFKFMEEPHNTELPALLNSISDKMQESTAPKTLTGEYPSGAPASAFALSVSTGAQIIEPIREALSRLHSDAARMVFDYMKVYPDFDAEHDSQVVLRMANGKETIDGSALPDWMDIAVEFEPDLPQDKIALMNVAMQAFAMKWLPRDKTYEVAKLEDINDIKKQWEEEGQVKPVKQGQAPYVDRTRVGNTNINLPPGTNPQAGPIEPTAPQPNEGEMTRQARQAMGNPYRGKR